MRASVSHMLSESGREPSQQHPDYDQQAHHHASLLVLIRGIGTNKDKSLQSIFERIQKVENVKVNDSDGRQRDIWVRFVQDHNVENNDWGDFQTFRRLYGLITVGKFDTQVELNELCRIHESLKVKYTNTLYDTRCLLFGSITPLNGDRVADSLQSQKSNNESEKYSTPNNFKSRAIFYENNDPCHDLETNIIEFISGLFWILESKRLEKVREKIDKIALLTAPFEAKDFVGLDLESRNNKKRCTGRATKNLGDLSLQAGLLPESLNLFCQACETLRAIGDSLWLGAAYEGLCSASVILLYPHLRNTYPTIDQKPLGNQLNNDTAEEDVVASQASSSSSSSISSSLSGASVSSSSSSEHHNVNTDSYNIKRNSYPPNILSPEEITSRYREAIINYSKYRHAGVIETEAALKAARICIEQNQKLDVAMFLQNVLYINLNMSEIERVKRFETLTTLYEKIGFHRKSAFCRRLAAWRWVAQTNTSPDWAQSYRLMLESFAGHKLSLQPKEVLSQNIGWPVLQIDLLQQLVVAARRLGHSALATRHMTFLLQAMWQHLNQNERAEMAMQLQNLSMQCEGSPVALNLENGTTIPPANLTDVPYCSAVELKNLPPYLRPQKIESAKVDSGPFLFTPLHFGSSLDRRIKGDNRKVDFEWVQNDLSEVVVKLTNPLPFELPVAEMRLLTNGVVFESRPETIVLQPNLPINVKLTGTPIEAGELIVQGYSTHTLGVKSNCELIDMLGRNFPPEYSVNVIPCLPQIKIETTAPQTNLVNVNSDVICSAAVSLFNGETQELTISLKNTSNVPIEYIDYNMQSNNIDQELLHKMFHCSNDDIQRQLPLQPNDSLHFDIKIFGEANFVGLPPQSSLIDTQTDGPNSLLQPLVSATIQSRMSSPIGGTPRRNELNSSFRSSGHSSINTTSLGIATGNVTRQIDNILRIRYSGGEGYKKGYCRQAAVSFNVEMFPSAQITNWDVLPAEVGSQFYLVLDIINLTTQEMTLNYTLNKTILIEAKESCRIPVPTDRCNLEHLLNDRKAVKEEDIDSTVMMQRSDDDWPEKLCAEHISNLVKLTWCLNSSGKTGIATLKGISLSNTMLDLITNAPLQWDITIDKVSVAPQSEISFPAGQSIALGVSISNVSVKTLHFLTLSIQFYQDYLNGMHNYRLETRVVMSGPLSIEIPLLGKGEKVFHECSVLFFTPGRFKADIQCHSAKAANSEVIAIANGDSVPYSSSNHNLSSHTWRFIPPIEITVVE